ncbi:MAG: tubulin-like doman-containing protein [Pseudomonadota bacterium]
MSSHSEHMARQGSIVPTLFIGLGGVGSRIVDRIALRAKRLPNWKSQLEPLTSFVAVDTNELDQHALKNIPDGNRLNISSFDKSKALESFRRSENVQASQWIDAGYEPRKGVKPGAGQIRIESRFGFFYHSPEIRKRLKQIVEATLKPGITWRQSQPPKYYVYVFCTLAGGTGSGSHLAMAYLIDEIIRENNWHPRVIGNLILSSSILNKIGPELHGRIHANSYAALKELEHMTKLGYQQVVDEGRRSDVFVYRRDEHTSEVTRVADRPFFLSFIFDRPPHISINDLEGTLGDAAFLQVFTPLMDHVAGELDNYELHQMELTTFPGQLRDVGLGYTKNHGAAGTVAMVLPGEDLLSYSAYRFAAHAVRTQITFGVDPRDSDDERSRALSRLAVNYNDANFLRKSEESRERDINHAFMESVRELARQDERDDLLDGYWYQLVESIDKGKLIKVDDKGQEQREESLVDRVTRKLGEDRQGLLNEVTIRDRAFVFYMDGINQYVELVSRLKEDIQAARKRVDEGTEGLLRAVQEGEPVTDLKLDPIAERYLVLRLLDLCGEKLIPTAQDQQDKAATKHIDNPSVLDRLEKEYYESLQHAAGQKKFGIFKSEGAFLEARDDAQGGYRDTARAARKFFEAMIQLRQLRALLDYLKGRSYQYSRLSTHMEKLVEELEEAAERLRKAEAGGEPPFALRVEVFETLEEPRTRIWDQVYQALYVADGAALTTYDRGVLSKAITEQLKPVIGESGRLEPKPVTRTVTDVRQALLDLGRTRLRGRIFGDHDQVGQDLASGLRIEARLRLKGLPEHRDGVPEQAIQDYIERKLNALQQLAGVFARVDSAESSALDDGVVSDRTRHVLLGLGGEGASQSATDFAHRIESKLRQGNRTVNLHTDGTDPRLCAVFDQESGIPLYYFKAILEEVEPPYIAATSVDRRGFMLHIDYNWEDGLPNLNPRKSEVEVGWSLLAFTEGLVTAVITQAAEGWTLNLDGQGRKAVLGTSLTTALYRLGEVYRNEDLAQLISARIKAEREQMGPEQVRATLERLREHIVALRNDLASQKVFGGIGREALLDIPVLRALERQAEKGLPADSAATPHIGKPRQWQR